MKWLLLILPGIFVMRTPAAVVRYGFAGQLNEPFGELEAGTPFHGEFSYERNQTDIIPVNPRGDYTLLDLSLTIEGSTLSDGGANGIRVWDNSTPGSTTDRMMLGTTVFFASLGGYQVAPNYGISIFLEDEGSLWGGAGLPGTGLTLADFNSGGWLQLTREGAGPGVPVARGPLTILVPEPSAGLWSVLLGLICDRRRRRADTCSHPG